MRILYFFQYFSTPQGGYGTRAYEFARRWVAAGDAVTVVTAVYDRSDLRTDRFISRLRIDGIDVRVIGLRISNTHSVWRRVFGFFAYAALSAWYGLSLPADVVICSSPPITAAVPGLLARWFRGRKLIFEVRDLWPAVLIELGLLKNRVLQVLAEIFERRCYRAASTVVALSEGIAAGVARSVPEANIEVITNACDNDAFDGGIPAGIAAWAAGKQIAVYAGAIGFANDCGQILEMAAWLEKNPAAEHLHVVIIGEGKERRRLQQRAAEIGLKRVRFLGQRPKHEVHGWLQAACCSLLVLRNGPITGNGSPNKLFDSLAAGLPVVHNTEGWMKRLIDGHACGLSAPPGDPRGLAEAVLLLVRSPELRLRLSDNAGRLARERFDRAELARRYRDVLYGSPLPPAGEVAAGARAHAGAAPGNGAA